VDHEQSAANHAQLKSDVAASSVDWDYFINLSAGDYPLLSPMAQATLYGNLLDHQTTFMSLTAQKDWPAGWTDRVSKLYLDPGLYIR
jgi:hypothetical protein